MAIRFAIIESYVQIGNPLRYRCGLQIVQDPGASYRELKSRGSVWVKSGPDKNTRQQQGPETSEMLDDVILTRD